MKKKITAICLCVALLAIAIVGATLAYFTDTKSATNTFTRLQAPWRYRRLGAPLQDHE